MAKILLATILVLIASAFLPDLARLRDFSWLRGLVARGAAGAPRSPAVVLVWPAILVALAALIQAGLRGHLFDLPGFVFAVVVLFFCWGLRDLDADIDAVLKAPNAEQRTAAAQALRPDAAVEPLMLSPAALVEATFASALSCWFGVLFWFVIAGPAGALAYRLLQLLARAPAFRDAFDAGERALLEWWALVLDWAPAHLMALSLAPVSRFDAVIGTWRGYHAAHGKGYFTLDLGFLAVLARASVDADVVAGDGHTADAGDPLVELADARTLLHRVLLLWLMVIALVVLAGWAG